MTALALPAGASRIACEVLHLGRQAVLRHDGRAKVIDANEILAHDAAGVVVTAAGAAELAGPPPSRCLTDADLARRFQKSLAWLYREFDTLVAEEGFPPPVSGRGHRRHDAAKVEAWFGRDPAEPPLAVARPTPIGTSTPVKTAPAPASRSYAEPLEHGEAAARELEETVAWRAALAEAYGSER